MFSRSDCAEPPGKAQIAYVSLTLHSEVSSLNAKIQTHTEFFQGCFQLVGSSFFLGCFWLQEIKSTLLFIIMRLTILILLSISVCCIDLEEYMEDEQRDPEVLFKQYEPNFKKTTNLQNFMFYTPWNRNGKDLIHKYAEKIDYVSPCWYEVALKDGHIIFQHESNYDLGYIKELKSKNPNIKIIPRVYVPGDKVVILQKIGSNRKALQELFDWTQKVAHLEGIDGLCWDTPFNSFGSDSGAKQLNQLIKLIINGMKEQMKDKLLFVNTARPSNVNIQLIKSLNFDGLLIQCYSGRQDPHQIAFIKNFIRKLSMKDKKFVIILPFFTKKNNGEMFSTTDAIKIMQEKGIRRSWYDTSCQFQVGPNYVLQVPCYSSFRESFEQIQQQQHMVGFWQGGNGLEIYYSFI